MCSGDAFLLFGCSRMRFHGVDKIYLGTALPGLRIKQEGRIALWISLNQTRDREKLLKQAHLKH